MNEERINRDYFGFLPYEWTIEFAGGKVSPIPEFNEVAASVNKDMHEDGFLYPPIEYRARVDPVTIKLVEKIPKTERPAHLYRIPPSHELCLSASGTPEDIRKGSGSFIIQLIAYLFGVRLQFYDWWVDSRVPIKERARTHGIRFAEKTAEEFLSHCYKTWKSWREKEQNLITNLLFMHTRTPSYEWDWERFTIEYMVLDACWKLATQLSKIQPKGYVPHGKRIEVLCQQFEIPPRGDLIRDIIDLRNGLFHETLWDGSQPGTAVSNCSFILPSHLRRLNQRLIMALLGYKTPYIKTEWWFFGNYSFDQP